MALNEYKHLNEFVSYCVHTTKHRAADNQIQEFKQIIIKCSAKGRTYYWFATDWLLLNSETLFVCCDEYGECLVEFSADYHGETLPLERFTRLHICANEQYLRLAYKIAELAKQLIELETGVDVSHVEIVNNDVRLPVTELGLH